MKSYEFRLKTAEQEAARMAIEAGVSKLTTIPSIAR